MLAERPEVGVPRRNDNTAWTLKRNSNRYRRLTNFIEFINYS
jgi:hypothetical protein